MQLSNLIRRALYRISARLPCRIIADSGQPYLERYFVFQGLGVVIYLHRFVAADPDRGLHDHPWPWAFSCVLAGEYQEARRSGMRQVRWFNFLTGDSFHRVLLEPGARSVWTLFVHRNARVKPWGFWRDGAAEQAVWVRHGNTRPSRWWLEAPAGHRTPERMPVAR